MDVTVNNVKVEPNTNENVEGGENTTGTAIQVESSADNQSQVLVQNANQDTSKELGLKIENLLSTSLNERDEDISNKENQEANIISDLQSRDATVSNVILQSPKPLIVNKANTNKLIKETSKPNIETSLAAKHAHSKELSDVIDTTVTMKEGITNAKDVVSNSAINTNTSIHEDDGDSFDNMQKLAVSPDRDSSSETQLHEGLGNKETCPSSNADSTNQITECTENVHKVDSNKSTEADGKQKEAMQETYMEGECNEDADSKMDISVLDIETTNEREDTEKDDASQNIHVEDKCEIKEKEEEIGVMKPKMENLSEPLDVSIVASQSSIVSEDETTALNLPGTENANNLLILASAISESSQDFSANLENSTSVNKNKDDVSDLVKSTRSSAVTEIPDEAPQAVGKESEKEELSEKTSQSDESSTLKEQSESEVQSNNEQEELEVNKTKVNEEQENMEVDDDDSDANTENLFQDIPADEWKEKSPDIDKESVHSMSTERLGNESETDCDLVLVDREAWLAAENIKAEQEKEIFDYDSDDTVLLKRRKDSIKAWQEEKSMMDRSAGESKMNTSKNKALDTSTKRKSMQQKENKDKTDVTKDAEDKAEDVEDSENVAEDMEDRENVGKGIADADNVVKDALKTVEGREDETQDTEITKGSIDVCKRKSTTKEITKQSDIPDGYVLVERLNKESSPEPHKSKTKRNLNKSTNSPLNKSQLSDDIAKKRKSLNESMQDVNDEVEKSSRIESAKKKKFLNNSKSKKSEMIEIESDNEDTAIIANKEPEENQSVNSSSKKKVKAKQLDASATEKSDSESEVPRVIKRKNNSLKKTLHYSTVAHVGSDSDKESDIDSENSQNETVKVPKYLFAGGSDSDSDSDTENKSNRSIDSDVQREYNLDGKDITEFPDDDEPGDECRASETESSDPDDDGADLIDFVVDDDEVDEEDEENGEEEEGSKQENEENEKVRILEESDGEENEEDDGEQVEAVEEQDDEATEEQAEEMEVDEESNEEEEAEEMVMKKEKEEKDEQESVKEVNKTLDISSKKNNKPRKSMDSNSLSMTKNDKEKRKSIIDVSSTEKCEKEHNLSNKSLSTSLKMKKGKEKRMLIEDTGDMVQQLNTSPLLCDKKIQKLNKSMECSTPKTSLSKQRFNITLNTLDGSLENSRKKLSDEIGDVAEDTYSKKEKIEDTVKMENSSKKLNKLKNKEDFMHKSLPSELIELRDKWNVAKPVFSKVLNLNKSTLTPYSESPTIKHLRKEKLNDSLPALKLDSNSSKLLNNSINNKPNKEENVDIEEQDAKVTEKINDSLKKKLLKIADNILENDHQKKRKKRKRNATEETKSIQFIEDNLEENTDSQIIKNKQKHNVSASATDENDVQKEMPAEKKKKKKKKINVPVAESLQEQLCENSSETRAGSNDEVHNEVKKKKKTNVKIKYDVENQEPMHTKVEKEKKIAVPCEEVPTEKLSKRNRKLLSECVVPQSEQISAETVLKKKKKKQKLSEDTSLQQEEISTEELPKKKQKKLSKDTNLSGEEISTEELPKKKQKLLSKDVNLSGAEISTRKLSKKKQKLLQNIPKNKEKSVVATKTSQQSSNVASDSDEAPKIVTFPKARNEALEMIKRASDSVKANKEIKKKKQREHIEKMQKETKIQKSESKDSVKKSNKTEAEKRSVKRLSDDILENLSDVPSRPLKKRKLLSKVESQELPSSPIYESKTKGRKAAETDDDFGSVSSCGGTTRFDVVNLRKIKKKKKASGVISFKQKMLARNSRQPVSAYLMYLEKQKASGKDKYCNKS